MKAEEEKKAFDFYSWSLMSLQPQFIFVSSSWLCSLPFQGICLNTMCSLLKPFSLYVAGSFFSTPRPLCLKDYTANPPSHDNFFFFFLLPSPHIKGPRQGTAAAPPHGPEPPPSQHWILNLLHHKGTPIFSVLHCTISPLECKNREETNLFMAEPPELVSVQDRVSAQ